MGHVVLVFGTEAHPLAAVRPGRQTRCAILLEAEPLDTHSPVTFLPLERMKDDEILVFDAEHDTSSSWTHDASELVGLEQRLSRAFIRSKKTTVRDGKGCSVCSVGEGARGEEEDVGIAGRMMEEVGGFEEAMLVVMLGSLKRVHVANKGQTVRGEL